MTRLCWVVAVLVGCGSPAEPLAVGDIAPDFRLEDVNATSSSFGESLGPTTFEGGVSVWYFGHANCGYCSSQFGELDEMYAAIEAELGLAVPIIGVNAAGYESANATITEGRDIPWLQDVSGDVWSDWAVEWRDIFVIDGDGVILDYRNLTSFDLNEDELFNVYQGMIVDAATP